MVVVDFRVELGAGAAVVAMPTRWAPRLIMGKVSIGNNYIHVSMYYSIVWQFHAIDCGGSFTSWPNGFEPRREPFVADRRRRWPSKQSA
ncbi:hypothetical protein C488_11674 [Natrinema pellirubrum DSM 15624]|uniref:Uncharacterized protein n=1 Tax=Natrinema pellirubrum (strain DSM 15624 / CIP 106293 / JCM 10476 / NCIMB 786 / 157) TaxID=797303 RepID=L0JLE1_NATP1|nr:hypothetical protein Natpe_2513 [Natrinema pellirubrum DSM 15624]ELY74276.1 hypothetical protein C488_11674 [Natrinema pellirubrum DSM 15624]